jgi:hypothetical protein
VVCAGVRGRGNSIWPLNFEFDLDLDYECDAERIGRLGVFEQL